MNSHWVVCHSYDRRRVEVDARARLLSQVVENIVERCFVEIEINGRR